MKKDIAMSNLAGNQLTLSKFKTLLAKAEKAAKESNLKKSDISKAIVQSRKSKK